MPILLEGRSLRRRAPALARIVLLTLALTLAGVACSTIPVVDYPTYREEFAARFRKGDYKGAAALTEKGAETSGPDRLIFLLDRALAFHGLGNYERSNQLLWEAEKIAAPHSYSSDEKLRANNTANLRRKLYHGEEFESVFISVYQSLNYALLGRDADAINSARAAENKLSRFRLEGNRAYEIPLFLRYFTAHLYERERNLPAAAEDFRLAKGLEGAGEINIDADLARLAVRARAHAEADAVREKAGIDARGLAGLYREHRDMGAALVLLEHDFIAMKTEHAEFTDLPVYKEPKLRFTHAAIFVDGEEVGRTYPALDLNKLAKQNLDAKLELYKADKAAGFPGGELRRERLAETDPGHRDFRGYDEVAKLTADLRQWSTLPAELQMARIALRPGIHRVMLRLEAADGRRGPFRDLGDVEIRAPGDTKLVSHRSLHDWE